MIHYHVDIHKALRDAARLDLVDRNVAELRERPTKAECVPSYYSVKEASELLEKLCGHWLWLSVLLSLFLWPAAQRSAGLTVEKCGL